MNDQVLTMPPLSKFNRQPTLPHLLQDYGFQNVARQIEKKSEKTEKKKVEKKSTKKGDSFVDEEKDPEKEREMDEHYLKMVTDMYQLRDFYYNEYSALLGDKVEKQRRKIRERDAKLTNAQEKKEEEERKACHRVKKRLERHTLDTTPATVTAPKTDLYYIMGLEDKLRKEGKLKTPTDFSKFRRDINEPHIFYANFKVNKNLDYTKYSETSIDMTPSYASKEESHDTIFEMIPDAVKKSTEQEMLQQQQQHQQRRSLSRISESRESPVPISRIDSWAITQQFPPQFRSRKSISNINTTRVKPEPQLSDLEKRFPKLEMPKLHCFTLNLDKKPPDPEEVKQQVEIRTKEKGRRRAMRTYNKMYQLAMTNAATTSRIIDNFDDMSFLLQGPDLCDVIADHHWMKAYGLNEMNREAVEGTADQIQVNQDENLDAYAQHGHSHETTPIMEASSAQGASRGGSAVSERTASRKSRRSSGKSSRRSSAKSKGETSPEDVPPKIIPLTMGEMQGGFDIKESKQLSSLWNNYLMAGTSPWLRPEQ